MTARLKAAYDAAVENTLDNGGGTFERNTLAPVHPTSGYAVGLHRGTFRSVSWAPDHLRSRLALAIAETRATDCAYIGTWSHGDIIDVDPVAIVATLADALALARANGQHAVYSFAEDRTCSID